MADVNHQVSKALVEANPAGTLFVLEDLKGCRECMIVPYGKSRRPMLVGWAYLDLEGKLAYKAARAGSIVIKVDPAYTSQACPPSAATQSVRTVTGRCTCLHASAADTGRMMTVSLSGGAISFGHTIKLSGPLSPFRSSSVSSIVLPASPIVRASRLHPF